MKLKCSIIKIKEALLAVEKITGKNLTLPVLSSILWVAKDKKLQLKATNLSLGIEVEIPAKIEKEGVVAIKGDILSSLFSVLQGDSDVYFELINENLSVKTKQNTILIKSIPHEDFPSIPKVKGDSFNISSKKLIEGIKSVYYSAAISDIKPEIGSIYIYPEENNLVFVATDSFRLAEKKIKIKKDLSFEDILIPFKNASEIIRLFDNKSDEIEITLEKNKISFSVDNTYLTSRVVDGVFPDYNQIIPKNIKTQAVVLKQDFINALKVANIFSDKFNQVTISIKPEEKMFEVETRNLELGENNTFISGALKGEDIITSFNYKYILDCFQSINQDSVIVEFSEANKPMIIRPVGDNSFLYLIMPMNK